MKISFISDTHTKHKQLNLEGGDLLIHSGDLSNKGSFNDLEDFLLWFGKQPYRYKIFIAGNHDFCFQDSPARCRQVLKEHEEYNGNIIYLEDSGIEIEGIKIWGSPWQPEFHNWAFNLPRGQKLADKWSLIPDDVDVLITHGPPYGILDIVNYSGRIDYDPRKDRHSGSHQGCQDLMDRVSIIKPKVHCFGHIHEQYGCVDYNGTKFINASSVNLHYIICNQPINIEY